MGLFQFPFLECHPPDSFGETEILVAEGFKEASSPGTSWYPIVMKKKSPPFDDPRVRQAFRLMLDRQQVVDNVFEGKGKVGNDMFSPFDAAYAKDLPQRDQDLEQAKSLLKQAGVFRPTAV